MEWGSSHGRDDLCLHERMLTHVTLMRYVPLSTLYYTCVTSTVGVNSVLRAPGVHSFCGSLVPNGALVPTYDGCCVLEACVAYIFVNNHVYLASYPDSSHFFNNARRKNGGASSCAWHKVEGTFCSGHTHLAR